MTAGKKDSPRQFALKFNTKDPIINARSLADSLNALSNAIEYATLDGKQNANIAVCVTAVKEGSFELWFEVIEKAPEVMEYAAVAAASLGFDRVQRAMETVVAFLNIKKAIGNEKPKVISEDADKKTANISYGDGATFQQCTVNIETLNLFQNPNVERAFARSAGSLKQNAVEGFSIIDQDMIPLAHVDKTELEAFQKTKEEPEHPDKIDIDNTTLSLRKIVFSGREKWGFVYNGNQISASISDKDFNEGIESGSQKFANGDKLEVALEVVQKYDKASDSYVNKTYRIRKVRRHIPRTPQIAMT